MADRKPFATSAQARSSRIDDKLHVYTKTNGKNRIDLSTQDTAIIEMADAPGELKAQALVHRGVQNWREKRFKASTADFEAALAISCL